MDDLQAEEQGCVHVFGPETYDERFRFRQRQWRTQVSSYDVTVVKLRGVLEGVDQLLDVGTEADVVGRS